jgi:DNA-binding GntR family transcriptional regulator
MTSTPNPPIDRDLVERIVRLLQERIGNGEVKVGSWLRQERLAQELGVSRMPVREALRQLQALGTVEIVANRGARVTLPSARDLVEVYRLRGVLEAHAATAACQLITSAQLERLQLAHEMFEQLASAQAASLTTEPAEQRPSWCEANDQFHAVIMEASGNAHLLEVVDNLHRKIPRNLTWLGLGGDPARLARNAAEHGEILAAISAGDAQAASRHVLAHAQHASELLLQVLNETSAAS